MAAAGSTEMDAIEMENHARIQLLNLVNTIYRQHWIRTLNLEQRAMISREDLSRQIDLQPVLEAIVLHALPEDAHTRVINRAVEETASYREVAKLDETKEAATQKLLAPARKRMRALQRVEKELGTTE